MFSGYYWPSAQVLLHPSCCFFGPHIQLSCKFASKVLPCNLYFWYYLLATENNFAHKGPGSLLHPSMQVKKYENSTPFLPVGQFPKVQFILQITPWEKAETGTFWKLTLIWFLPSCPVCSTFCFFHGSASTITTCIWIIISQSVSGETEVRPDIVTCNKENGSWSSFLFLMHFIY